MRGKKAIINVSTSLLLEILTIISAFLIPRLVLNEFGSSTNGITQSISQFISYISLLTAGVGAVTVTALYKPIAEKDVEKISKIVKATEIFMRKISKVFIISLLLFAIVYPIFVEKEFDYLFSMSLVIILGIGTLGNYYFGITYRMVLNADQKQYVNSFLQILVLILNTGSSIILIKFGASIHTVKFLSSLIYLINPICIYLFVIKKYSIIRKIKPDNSYIEQRWDAFAHQVANFVNDNTDLVILTIFTNLKEVSVYTVYYLVFNGIRALLSSVIIGTQSAFGNMFAKGETKSIEKNLKLYEFLLHSLSIVMYTSMALLITEFVDIYVSGVTDVNYHRPLFGYITSAIGFFAIVRIPYVTITRAAGHFRQTRNGAIIEAVMNIIFSLILVIPLGMIGLAIGTLIATIFRTIQYGIYSSKHIIKQNITQIIKRYLISVLNITTIVICSIIVSKIEISNFYDWIIKGFIVTGIGIVITLLYSLIFYKNNITELINFVFRTLKIKK